MYVLLFQPLNIMFIVYIFKIFKLMNIKYLNYTYVVEYTHNNLLKRFYIHLIVMYTFQSVLYIVIFNL